MQLTAGLTIIKVTHMYDKTLSFDLTVFGVIVYNAPMKSGVVQQLLPYAQQADNSSF